MLDGKLRVTNAPDMTPRDVITRYKSPADIERGFKVFKAEIEIGPVHRRLPEHIRAHAAICFIALILHRVLRGRLRQADSGLSPERLLERWRRTQHHRVRLNGGKPVAGVSTRTPEQASALSAIGVRKPTLSEQLTLL